MKPTIQMFMGSPVVGAEAKAVKRLHSDLCSRNLDALMLVNVNAGRRQIDCVVVTPNQATLLDFKEITGPLRGELNGAWHIKQRGGGEVRYSGENPYSQVSNAKYALSDEMGKFQRKHDEVPKPSKNKFFEQFEAAVCICPEIAPGSKLNRGDFKCRIWGYPEALEAICCGSIQSSWSLLVWKRFAKEHLLLQEASLHSATDPGFRESELLLSGYTSRLVAFLNHGLPPELPNVGGPLPKSDHFVLLGQSGSGKTIRLQHHALTTESPTCTTLGSKTAMNTAASSLHL